MIDEIKRGWNYELLGKKVALDLIGSHTTGIERERLLITEVGLVNVV